MGSDFLNKIFLRYIFAVFVCSVQGPKNLHDSYVVEQNSEKCEVKSNNKELIKFLSNLTLVTTIGFPICFNRHTCIFSVSI